MRIGRLKINARWTPCLFTKMWRGGKWSISIMWETDRLRAMRDKLRATAAKRREQREND